MGVTTSEAPPSRVPRSGARSGWRWDLPVLGAIAVVALVLALTTGADHRQAAADIARGLAASLLLFVICGDALALALVPRSWGHFVPLASVAAGAMSSGLVLTAFGFARVPLSISLWVTLALAIAASVLVRRAVRGHLGRGRGVLGRLYPGTEIDWRQLAAWLATALILLCLALIPAWRTRADTIYGENPDSHQVVGIAVLFQHVVPPTGRDDALPIDTVPPAWRFRYPIIYPLAAASNIAHFDPIRVFPAMAALMMVACALGFAMLAVICLRAPPASGPAIAAAFAIWWVVLWLGWHPYWNQLWGVALFPYATLFGWHALAARDVRAGALFIVLLVMLELAYPLALPYPILIFALLAVAYRRRPRLPRMLRSRAWLAALIGAVVLAPALIAAALKLSTALHQILIPNQALWGGDIWSLTPLGRFVGVGGGLLPALAVLALAIVCLALLPRRVAVALSVTLLILFAVDIRFRTAGNGAYMDFKHLSFTGSLVFVLAASAVAQLLARRSGSRVLLAMGGVIAILWTAAAVRLDRQTIKSTSEQVTPELFQIREWAQRLPRGASVRVDVPASGLQLWAVYMLGSHPVDSPNPVITNTYAHAPYGRRADYSIALRYALGLHVLRPLAPVLYARNPPLFENDQFVIRRIQWPARLASAPSTASQTLVEP